MNIVDWFDVANPEHLKAYKHLQDTGLWPEGFLPEDIEIEYVSECWPRLDTKLADKFVEERLSKPTTCYEDYSYYVGGEIMCGRMPLKYASWIAAGRPA